MVGAVGVNVAVSTVSREKSDHAKYLWQWQVTSQRGIHLHDGQYGTIISEQCIAIHI